MSDTSNNPYGLLEPRDTASEHAGMEFFVRGLMNKMWTMTLVKVISCTCSGTVAAPGFVDVQPLVNMIDGIGQSTSHSTIHNLPFVRLQGGGNAAIIDPVAGDIGLALFAHNDISTVKKTKGVANPGSRRRNRPADGVYLGGVLNGAPTQYAMFNGDGITLVSPTKVICQAPEIDLNTTNVNVSGSLNVAGANLTHQGQNVGKTHYHGNGNQGANTTTAKG